MPMEEVLPPETETGAGFESARVHQFTVFMENKVGQLQHLVRTVEDAGCRVAALCINNATDAALVRLILSDPTQGRSLLEQQGFSYSEQDILAVELPRRSRHPLLAVTAAMLTAEINIHYAYPLLTRSGHPTLALYVDDIVLASQLLIRKRFRLLADSDLEK